MPISYIVQFKSDFPLVNDFLKVQEEKKDRDDDDDMSGGDFNTWVSLPAALHFSCLTLSAVAAAGFPEAFQIIYVMSWVCDVQRSLVFGRFRPAAA